MNCRDVDALLPAYADGELVGTDREDVDAHLASCRPCRSRVDFELAFKRRLRLAVEERSTREAAPDRLRASLLANIAAEPPPGRPSFTARAAKPAAALAVAAACAAVYLHQTSPRNRTAPFIASAVAHHQRELPLEVTDGQLPVIQGWFKGKVDFAPSRIPTLSNVSVLGARLSHIRDRQAAYVAYGAPDGRGRVSLFVFDAPELEVEGVHRIRDRDVMIANQAGYNVAIWKDNEIAYSLVSDLSEEDILQLVSAADR